MDWKNSKKLLVLEIIATELGATSSVNFEKDTCYWQSMCYEISLSLNISRREIFFKTGSIRVIEKYDESALNDILQGFETPYYVYSERVFWNSVF